MQASQTRLINLVEGERQFQVPLYQRTYTWVERNLEQLWSDIVDQALLTEEGRDGTHFLGSIVLAPSPLNEAAFTRLLVIDGQQRLTTLLIALIAVRDHLAVSDARQGERIDELYLVNKWRSGTSDYLKLLPTQTDRPSFDALVRGTHSGGNDKIYETYRFFAARLEALGEDITDVAVTSIERAITSRLAMVSITADHGDNVHRIFESINNTGARLSQADLMRNHVFMRLPTRAEHVYQTYWIPLQESMSNEDLERLLWLQLVLDGDARVSQEGLYDAQQRQFEKSGDEAAVEQYVAKLLRRSRSWLRIIAPETEPGSVGESLRRLKTWQAVATDPITLMLLDASADGSISEQDLQRGLDYIESYLVRRMICQLPTNSLGRIFQAIPSQLPSGIGLVDGIHQVLSDRKRDWPTDTELSEAIHALPFYLRGRGAQRRLVMQRLEESFGHREHLDFERSNLTIEHILPQSPNAKWLAVLSAETKEGENPSDLHQRLVNTLGNLTLTAYNAELANDFFDRKRQLLGESNLETNRRIAELERWGAAEIAARADDLAERAVALWPAPLPRLNHSDRTRDWSLLRQALVALPEGTWTTYGNLAALIGSQALPVGQYLANTPGLTNAYRVLTVEGKVAPQFRWSDPDDTRDIYQVLRDAGITIDEQHKTADPSQLLTVQDLVALVGLAEPLEPARPTEDTGAEREVRFQKQLIEANPGAVVAAVNALLADWSDDGGRFEYGAASVTSCFPMLDRPREASVWPCAIVPSSAKGGGRIEVVFQYLLDRRPFGDTELRQELRIRLNRLEGVSIPSGKIGLRPSFDLSVLSTGENADLLKEAFGWFRTVARME
ncbi:alkylated DNA nucleotide flippase Atl1 [Catenulispora sp. GP43]|uniref:GmrSD restriction endonuclease domain-containing protein n=1 Tax=Catenulispora sp. GP43 TaxID=3156263 RepID=UPI0035140EFE